MQRDYILIVGQGRSGTNWLLDLLDFSPYTHCRNEPNELDASPLAQLPSPFARQPLGDSFPQEWDQAVASTSLRMGDRDRTAIHPKSHIYEPVRRLGGALVLGKRRVRQLLSPVFPSLGQSEWSIPWWFAHPNALKQATTVLKLNSTLAWAEWVLLNRPSALVIHIVRHPGGYMNSWKKRCVAGLGLDPVNVKKDNDERLRQVVESDPQWAELFGNIDAMSIEESELWYWRYIHETLYQVGHERPNYMRLIYEDLVADPLQVMKSIYEKCNLPWTTEIEREISNSASRSKSIATAWHKKLQPEQVELVRRIFKGSFMAQWWEE
jgi:hypothetical protein